MCATRTPSASCWSWITSTPTRPQPCTPPSRPRRRTGWHRRSSGTTHPSTAAGSTSPRLSSRCWPANAWTGASPIRVCSRARSPCGKHGAIRPGPACAGTSGLPMPASSSTVYIPRFRSDGVLVIQPPRRQLPIELAKARHTDRDYLLKEFLFVEVETRIARHRFNAVNPPRRWQWRGSRDRVVWMVGTQAMAAPRGRCTVLRGLEQYLAALPATETTSWLTLNDIESLTGGPLPPAAKRAAFWSRGHDQ